MIRLLALASPGGPLQRRSIPNPSTACDSLEGFAAHRRTTLLLRSATSLCYFFWDFGQNLTEPTALDQISTCVAQGGFINKA